MTLLVLQLGLIVMFFSIEELNTLLNAKERVIKKRFNNVPSPSMAMNVNF